MLTPRHEQLLDEHKLQGKIVEAADINVEDNQIDLLYKASGLTTGTYVQISLGGWYHVNQMRETPDGMVISYHGEFRSLTRALEHAVKIATVT